VGQGIRLMSDRDYLRLTEKQLQDATSFLQSLAAIRTDSCLQQTPQTQVVCTLIWIYLAITPTLLYLIGSSWSRQPDFGAVSACICDGSLLAVGNRAGSILLLK
jgi:hypothetical protein